MTSVRGASVLLPLPILLAGVLAAAPAPGSAAEPAPADPARRASYAKTTDGTRGVLVSGEESYLDGTHTWTDYVYDDRGPNADPFPGGDEPAPAAPAHLGTADLVQVRTSTTPRGALRTTAVLRTLVPGEHALVGLGLDTDRDPATGAPSVPGGGWGNTDPLGLEHLVTMSTDGTGHLWSWTDGEWVRGEDLPVWVDDTWNTVRTEVRAIRPGRATWRAVSLAGRASSPRWRLVESSAHQHTRCAESPRDARVLRTGSLASRAATRNGSCACR